MLLRADCHITVTINYYPFFGLQRWLELLIINLRVGNEIILKN